MDVAQLVRAPGCGSGGRRFETDLPPKVLKAFLKSLFLFYVWVGLNQIIEMILNG